MDNELSCVYYNLSIIPRLHSWQFAYWIRFFNKFILFYLQIGNKQITFWSNIRQKMEKNVHDLILIILLAWVMCRLPSLVILVKVKNVSRFVCPIGQSGPWKTCIRLIQNKSWGGYSDFLSFLLTSFVGNKFLSVYFNGAIITRLHSWQFAYWIRFKKKYFVLPTEVMNRLLIEVILYKMLEESTRSDSYNTTCMMSNLQIT